MTAGIRRSTLRIFQDRRQAYELEIAGHPGDFVKSSRDRIGVDGTMNLGRERLSRELVNDVQDLHRPAVSCLIELKICCPDHIRCDRTHCTGLRPNVTEWSLVLPVGNTQTLFSPQAVNLLVIDQEPFSSRHRRRTSPSPPWAFCREAPKPRSKDEFFLRW